MKHCVLRCATTRNNVLILAGYFLAIQRVIGPRPMDCVIASIRGNAMTLDKAYKSVTIQCIASHI